MSRIIQLPGGQTAHLREPGQVPERLRRPVTRALMHVIGAVDRYEHHDDGTVTAKSDEQIGSEMIASGGMDALTEASDLCALALVTDWSLGTSVDIDTLLDLPAETYEAIRGETDPHLWSMTPKSFAVSPKNDSPTRPSGD